MGIEAKGCKKPGRGAKEEVTTIRAARKGGSDAGGLKLPEGEKVVAVGWYVEASDVPRRNSGPRKGGCMGAQSAAVCTENGSGRRESGEDTSISKHRSCTPAV